MSDLLGYTIAGIVVGCIYAFTSTGLVVTYITSGIFNFAHGAIGMIAAFAYWDLSENHSVPVPIALFLVVFVMAPLLGALIDGLLMRKLHGAPTEVTLVVTLGLLLLLIGVAFTLWPAGDTRYLPEFFAGHLVRILGVNVSYHQLTIVVLAVVVGIGLRLFLYRTRSGIALRAVVDSPELAALNGATPNRVSQLGWAIGATLAAIAGILLAPLITLDVLGLTLLVVNGYAAAMVGRLKSLPMTFAGGLVLGLFEQYLVGYLPGSVLSQLRTTLPIIFLFVVLLIFPASRLQVGRSAGRRALRLPNLRTSLGAGAAFVALSVVAANVLGGGDAHTMAKGIVLALIMLSLVLLTGYGGQISLCQLTFVGFGAFAMGKVGGGGSLLGFGAAIVASAALGALVALPALRLRGLYLALSTLAFAQAMSAAFFNNNNIFGQGGALRLDRLDLPGVSLESEGAFLVFAAVVFAAAAIGVLAIRRSWAGRRLAAMADSPAACATLGLNLTSTKLAVFTVSAGLAGLAGALYGGLQGSVGTNDFTFLNSLVLLLLAVIWGVDSIVGVLLAGLLFALFPTLASSLGIANLQFLATGLGVIGLSRSPGGVVRQVAERIEELRRRRPAAVDDALAPVTPLRPRPRPRPATPEVDTVPPALELRGIRAGYGGIEVVHGVDLVVPPASVTALLGPNGAGKSTLLKVASCTLAPIAGCVHIAGIHVNGTAPERLARVGVCTIPEGRGIFANLTVVENLRMMSFREGTRAAAIEEQALTRFPALATKRTQLAGTLSGGEQQMLAMARAVATDPTVLLLDEISMGLAPLIVEHLYELVHQLAAEGLSILIVEQFANTALAVADFAAVMTTGTIHHLGEAGDIRSLVSEAYFGASA